jgi:hypothetical protein
MVEDFFREVAMRIDETDAFAGSDVPQNQIAKKCALPHTTFTDQKQMLAPIRSTDAERVCPAPDTPMTNMADAIRINHAPEPNPRPINLILLVKKMTSKSGNRCVFASRSGGWDWLWNASVSSPLFLNDIVHGRTIQGRLTQAAFHFLTVLRTEFCGKIVASIVITKVRDKRQTR